MGMQQHFYITCRYRFRQYWSHICILTGLLFTGGLFAQEGEYNYYTGELLTEAEQARLLPDSLPVFGPEEPLEVRVISDLARLSDHKFRDEYQFAVLEIRITDSVLLKRAARIKPRGKSRLRTCDFPPIKLNLNGTRRIFQNLDHLEKLKVVNLCFLNRAAEDYIYKEYLIYQMYRMLTDTSFRVRLVKTTYEHSLDRGQKVESVGFLIEDGEMVARRLGMDDEGKLRNPEAYLSRSARIQLALFEYMIGNADYSLEMAHNIRVLRDKGAESSSLAVLPYDFDSSGMVDADYAKPNPDYLQTDVKDRVYLGPCIEPNEYKAAFAPFRSLRKDWIDLIKRFEPLDKKAARQMTNYLKTFYEIIGDTEASRASFSQAPWCTP